MAHPRRKKNPPANNTAAAVGFANADTSPMECPDHADPRYRTTPESDPSALCWVFALFGWRCYWKTPRHQKERAPPGAWNGLCSKSMAGGQMKNKHKRRQQTLLTGRRTERPRSWHCWRRAQRSRRQQQQPSQRRKAYPTTRGASQWGDGALSLSLLCPRHQDHHAVVPPSKKTITTVLFINITVRLLFQIIFILPQAVRFIDYWCFDWFYLDFSVTKRALMGDPIQNIQDIQDI